MDIHFMRADDWIGLYINGELVEQGHNISEEELTKILLDKLGEEHVITNSWHGPDDEYLGVYSSLCPERLPEELAE